MTMRIAVRSGGEGGGLRSFAMQLHLAASPRFLGADGSSVELAARDAALLAWLALEGPTPRSRLAALLWPDSDADAARNALRQRLFTLRKSLGFEAVVGSATLALAEGIAHDLEDADSVLGEAAPVAGGEFAAWLEQQRSRRRDRTRQSLAELAQMAEDARDWADALSHAQELLALEPLSEAAHRRVMRLHYLGGDRAAALLAFDRCEQMLKDEIGARPSSETLALLASIDSSGPAALAVAGAAVPASVLRPPRLIGRERELAQLTQGFAGAQVVAVIGDAGLGKSRLLQEFAQARAGLVHVSARPGDAGVPFASLARLLRAVTALAPTQPALEDGTRREIARVLPEFDSAVPRAGGEGQRLVLQRAVQALLMSQAELAGLLVDDLHFADPASLDMLLALIDATGSDEGQRGAGLAAALPLRWALAYRPAEAGSPLQALHDALVEHARLQPLALAPLDEAALAALVDSLGLPGVEGRTLAPGLLQRTGGNPLFVLETLKQAWVDRTLDRLADVQHLPRPLSVGRLIERRLGQLSPAALALARLASIAGVDFEIELAEQVLGASAMQFADALNELEAAHVLRGDAFAHDLVFETVQASVPATIAARTHGQVAAWLEARAGEPARIAEHWIAARQGAAAIAPLREAAERSAARTAFAAAAQFLERAAHLCRAASRRADEFEVLERLGYFYTFEDPGAPHDGVVERLLAIAQGEPEHVRAEVAGHDLLRRRQRHSEPQALELLLQRAKAVGDERSVWSLVTLLVAAYVQRATPDDALALIRQHKPLVQTQQSNAELGDMQGNLSVVLANLDRFDEALDSAQHALSMMRRLDSAGDTLQVLCNLTRVYRMQGRMATALAAFDDIDRWHAAAAPNPRAWSAVRAPYGELLCDLERPQAALEALDVQLDVALRAAGRVGAAWPIARAKIWLRLGQHTRAQQALAAEEERILDAPRWLKARWYLTQAQVMARSQGGGDTDTPGASAMALLDRSAHHAPRDQRRSAWLECELQRSAWIDASAGAALAQVVASLARQQGMMGHALHALYRVAERRLTAGQLDEAFAAVRQARTLRAWRFGDNEAAEPVFPSGSSLVEIELIDARIALAVNEAGAPLGLEASVNRLRRIADEQVPEPFRDSFLQRNPVNREMLALAQRVSGGRLA